MGYTPGQPEDVGMVKVVFDINMSRGWMRRRIKLEKGGDGRGVTIHTGYRSSNSTAAKHKSRHPKNHHHHHPPCASINVLVYIPRGNNISTTPQAVLGNMDIDVESLSITIDHSSLDLLVQENTTLQSLGGDINLSVPPGGEGPQGDLGERDQFPWTFGPPPPPPHRYGRKNSGSGIGRGTGLRTRHLKAKTLTGRIHAGPATSEAGMVVAENVELETTSGDIRVSPVVQKHKSTTASSDDGIVNITIRTVSGDVLLDRMETHKNVDLFQLWRKTNTHIHTTTGRILGETVLTHGSILDVKSLSGDIDLIRVTVQPSYTNTNTNATTPRASDVPLPLLKTDTKTGSTRVRVLPPCADKGSPTPEDPNDATLPPTQPLLLTAHHTTISGRISTTYHSSFTGTFLGRTLSGKILAHGKDVLITPSIPNVSTSISYDDDFPFPDSSTWTTVHAQTGDVKFKGGNVQAKSVTGNIDFFVGQRNGFFEKLGREWLRKLESMLGKERKAEVASVGVQTDRKSVV